MIEVKTIDLIGPALDWVVATLDGWQREDIPLAQVWMHRGRDARGARITKPLYELRYSTDRNMGGLLIEQHKITTIATETWHSDGGFVPLWAASVGPHPYSASTEHVQHDPRYQIEVSDTVTGPTPLIAAMRCYVAAHLGKTVTVPVELLACQ